MFLRKWYIQDQHQESLQFAWKHLIPGMSALDFNPRRFLEIIGDLCLEKIVTDIQDMGMEVEGDYFISLDPFKSSWISVKFKY